MRLLQRIGQRGVDDGVLEEAAGIADHRGVGQLAGAQVHHGFGDMERCGLVHAHPCQLLGDAGVVGAQRAAARQHEAHGGDDVAARLVLEQRVAIGKRTGRPVQRHHPARMDVPRFHALDELGHLAAVGADVLDRCGAHGAGNQDQVFEPGVALPQRPAHEVVPAFAGGDGDARAVAIALHLHAAGRHQQHGAVEVAGEQHVAALAQHQQTTTAHSGEIQQLGQLGRVADIRQQGRPRVDTQGIQPRQRGVLDQGIAAHVHALNRHGRPHRAGGGFH